MHGTIQPFARARIVRRDDSWTYRETEVLREHWPDMAAMRKLLPHRTEKAIRGMAAKCGAAPPKEQHIWTAAEDKRLRALAASGATRKEMAVVFDLSPLQVQNRLQYARIRVAKRPPISCGNALVDAVRLRAFHLNISMVDLDRSLGKHRIFEKAVSNRHIAPHHIDRAVKALGGRLEIVWDEE
jgi:hypothetical protein